MLLWCAGWPAGQAANFNVITDEEQRLRIDWLLSPIDTGGNPLPTFDVPAAPALNNWEILDATYTYHGGGTPSDVSITVRHTAQPHNNDGPLGNPATLNFSFPYTLTPPGGIGGSTSATVNHPGIGHVDEYLLAWGYANYIGPGIGGTLAVTLTGKHVPESMGAVACHTFLLSMLGVGAVYARRRPAGAERSE